MRIILFLALLRCCITGVMAEGYPPVNYFGETNTFGHGVQRTMRLLAGSTPENRNTVRILFYGQSITAQAWWLEVVRDLRERYPYANIVATNLSIGGFQSDVLLRTSETDVYPFYPDLVIFQVYGPEWAYESTMQGIRRRTTAEVLLQTDHILTGELLEAPAPIEEINPALYPDGHNYYWLPGLARRIGAELADVRTVWRRYLTDHALEPDEVLADGVHLNKQGEFLMAEAVKPHLRFDPAFSAAMPHDAVSTFVIGQDVDWTGNMLELSFSGNRVDLLGGEETDEPLDVWIDGKRPSEFPELFVFTRCTPFPNSPWPLVFGLQSQTKLQPELWRLTVTSPSTNYRDASFRLEGSVTGFDGEGKIGQRFVSDSGRVVIPAEAWAMSIYLWTFNVPIAPITTAEWSVIPQFQDAYRVLPAGDGIEPMATVAQGITNGLHTLALQKNGASRLRAIRIYNPDAFRRPGEQPEVRILKRGGQEIVLGVSGEGLIEVKDSETLGSVGWNRSANPTTGPVVAVPVREENRFFRLEKIK